MPGTRGPGRVCCTCGLVLLGLALSFDPNFQAVTGRLVVGRSDQQGSPELCEARTCQFVPGEKRGCFCTSPLYTSG